MSFLKSLLKTHLASTSIALLSFALIAKPSSAAVVGLGDSASYFGNPNSANYNLLARAIAPLGYQMVPVIDSSIADKSPVSSLLLGDSSGSSITFNPSLIKATVPDTFGNFGHSYTGPVYTYTFNSTDINNTLTINLPSGTEAIDFFVAPNGFGSLLVTATATDGTPATVLQQINGSNGSAYFGFYSDSQSQITSVQVTAPGAGPNHLTNPPSTNPADILDTTIYAIGQFRVSSPAISIPEPSSELGELAFGVLGVGYLLKRQLRKAI